MIAHWNRWVNLFVVITLVCAGILTPASAQTAQTSQTVAAAIEPGAPGTAFRYVQTFGTTGVPYVSDTAHLNNPNGLITDAGGNIYVVEQAGSRLLKYDSSGSSQWAVSQPGRGREVAQDSDGNLWVANDNLVASYDASGDFRLSFPDNPWNNPDPDSQFGQLNGVAFDNGGRLYLADYNKNRIQVYTIGLDGVPVFAASLGSQGSGAGEFNSPAQIVIDSTDNSLYVADTENFRVQKCNPNSLIWPWGWTCANFHGGTQGSGSDQLDGAFGLGMDAAHNLLIADGNNGRVKRCTPACSTVIQASNWWPADVAAPDSSTLLVTDSQNFVIKKYTSGVFQKIVAGTAGAPYAADLEHFNGPRALALDPAGNVYMAENAGQRLFKFSPNGSVQWSVGTAGVVTGELCWTMGLAVGPDGKVYVTGACPDVLIYTSSGAYSGRFSTPAGAWATGVAVDASGNIYVSDGNLNKIYVYNSNHDLVYTIGTGYGVGNDQFASPRGLALDASGNLYVSDFYNCRVQKFNSAWQYLATFGKPGVCAENLDYTALNDPSDVAVDLQGRIYVAESWKSRVQVLDSAGKYLATLGNHIGTATGDLNDVEGVEVDRSGNVYLTDFNNSRIQKFALGVPGWRQANLNGFFDPNNAQINTLETFGDYLYAGTGNWSGSGSMVMRSADGTHWAPASAVNFGSADRIPAVIDMIAFGGWLYAATGWGDPQTSAQLWRTQDGTIWESVETRAFGIANAIGIGPFVISAVGGKSYLYAGVTNLTDGVSIFRSDSGEPGSWAPVATGGLGVPTVEGIDGFTEWNGQLFAAAEDKTLGGRVWVTTNGSGWSPLGPAGLGDIHNTELGAPAAFNGHVYVPTRNTVTGAQIFRLDGSATWTPVMQNGFGNVNNYKIDGLFVRGGKLYAVVDNYVDGMMLMVSDDAASWKPLIPPGFGNSNNGASLWNVDTQDFKGALYVGTVNNNNGGQIWEYLDKTIFIPVIKR